jgi:hypothetical protein
MAKGASKSVVEMLECREALVNTDELEAATEVARRRVPEIQAKLHRWAPVRNGTCGEPGAGTTGTPGSGGDSGKPTGRNTGRAPRVDLTCATRRRNVERGESLLRWAVVAA